MPRDEMNVRQANHRLILSHWSQLMAEPSYGFTDMWISDESWYKILNEKCPNLRAAFDFTRRHVATALKSLAGLFDGSNVSGVYYKKFMTVCPYEMQRRPVHFFYCHKSGSPSIDPVYAPTCEFHASQQGNGNNNDDSNDALNVVTPAKATTESPEETMDATDANAEAEVVTPAKATTEWTEGTMDSTDANAEVEVNSRSIYWESSEAAKLFGFDHGDDVYVGLQNRIKLLSGAISTCHGYRDIVDGGGENLSLQQVFDLRVRAVYLRCSYAVAIELLGEVTQKWTEGCCKVAIERLADVGIRTITFPRTIANYNVIFRTRQKFPHPDPLVANGIKQKPLLFELNPKLELDCKQFILENHDHFNVEILTRSKSWRGMYLNHLNMQKF
jgi:hypothetical protein